MFAFDSKHANVRKPPWQRFSSELKNEFVPLKDVANWKRARAGKQFFVNSTVGSRHMPSEYPLHQVVDILAFEGHLAVARAFQKLWSSILCCQRRDKAGWTSRAFSQSNLYMTQKVSECSHLHASGSRHSPWASPFKSQVLLRHFIRQQELAIL